MTVSFTKLNLSEVKSMSHFLSRNVLRVAAVWLALLVLPPDALSAQELNVYGYFSARMEKVFGEPEFDGTNVVDGFAAREFAFPSLNVMFQHQLTDNFKAFVNLSGAGAELVNVANMWGEYTASRYIAFRFGKTYRRFGLYNEILDAVPSYYGIEPPEAFDGDHLLISRTTILMVHGQIPAGSGNLNWSLSTDNGESGGLSSEGELPLGFDLNFRTNNDQFAIGLSGYTSGGETGPDIGLGEGSPNSGVLPWMAGDASLNWKWPRSRKCNARIIWPLIYRGSRRC